jgi:hypothetical protein
MSQLGTRALTLKVGATDFTSSVSNVRITAGDSDSDFTSFADAFAGGARLYKLAMTLVQDPAEASLWDKIWTAPGTSIACVVAPNGGTVVSATQPTFSGNAVIAEPDGDILGGEANKSTTARFTVDVEWEFLAKPIRAFA